MVEETVVTRERNRGSTQQVCGAGDTLGSYRLLRPAGEGANGEVWVAEHTKLGRRVALKLLRDGLRENDRSVARFFGEASPNLSPVFQESSLSA